jgi:hypothetical protein
MNSRKENYKTTPYVYSDIPNNPNLHDLMLFMLYVRV